MKPALTVIMPAYNSARTIERSIKSLVDQNHHISYELVVVDDASTDNTYAVVKSMCRQHSQIRLFRNHINLGGGATRNRAVQKARGDLIFCLDSDDLLPKGVLFDLIAYLRGKKADGVTFAQSRFFISTTLLTVSAKNPDDMVHRPLRLADLFRPSAYITQVNFLYTKKAFAICGGYPEHHGFDTQGFGHRFLAHNLKTYICPDTFYYHRQGYGKSYFEREYEKGLLSINYYLILEDILYAFSPKVIEKIFKFNIFSHSDISADNLILLMQKISSQDKKSMFSSYTSWENWAQQKLQVKKQSTSDCILSSVWYLKNNQYEDAQRSLEQLEQKNITSPILYYLFLRCIAVRERQKGITITEDTILRLLSVKPQKSIVSDHIAKKILRKGTQTIVQWIHSL